MTTPPLSLDPQVQEEPALPPPVKENYKRNKAIFITVWIFVVIGLLWLALWFFYLRLEEYTDDAYVTGNRILLKSQIQGQIKAYYVDDNDYVEQGDLLVSLDQTQYLNTLENEKQNLAVTVRNVRTYKDTALQREAELLVKQAELQKAQDDFDNRQAVIHALAVSKEDFQHSSTDLDAAKAAEEAAVHLLEGAVALAGVGTIAEHPAVLAQKANVKKAYVDVYHTNIFSPTSGYVSKRTAQVGDWAIPTYPLMSIIPYDQMWIEANYKETQLRYVRVGQPVSVEVDLYGGSAEFHGTVNGISSGTGSVFSLIPPQNATGNWIKIVQRLPVKITLDPEELKQHPLRLGLSVGTTIDISDDSGEPLRPKVPLKVVEKTDIYSIDMDPIDQEIEDIILNNSYDPPVKNSDSDSAKVPGIKRW